MKKLTISFMLIVIALAANAQTEKNNVLVGGNIEFSSSTIKSNDGSSKTKGTNIQLTPDVGYFFINNLAGGIMISLNSQHASYGDGDNSSTESVFTAGPFVRLYFGTNQHTKFFVHADASWGSDTYSYTGGNKSNSPISIFNGKAGVAFFLNPHVALEFAAGYRAMTETDKSGGDKYKTNYNSFVIGLGFQIHISGAKK